MKLIKKMDGAISIFLCLVLTSMIVLSGFLIDGSRLRVGEAQSQAAAEDSMRSALAGYNRMLKDLYGLFALSDGSENALDEEIEAYMNKTLMTELGVSKETMGEQTYSYLKSILTNKGTRKDVNFLNIFDYRIDELQSESIYNLAQTEVLGKQIVDYMKYRGPREISDNFLGKLGLFKELGNQSSTMNKKIKLDKDFDVVRKESESLSDSVEYINNFSTPGDSRIDELYRNFVNTVSNKAYMEIQKQIEEENMVLKEKEMHALQPALSIAKKEVDRIQTQIAQIARAITPQNASQLQQTLDSLSEVLSEADEAYEKVESEYLELKESYEKSRNRSEHLKEKIEECERNASQNKNIIINLIDTCINKCSEAENYINQINSNLHNINAEIKDINEKDLKDESGEFPNRIRLDLADKSSLASTVKLNDVKKACIENKQLLDEMEAVIKSIDYKSIHGTELSGVLNKDRNNITELDVYSYVSTYLKNEEILIILKKYVGRCNQTPIEYSVRKLANNTSAEDPRSTFQQIVDTVKSKTELSDSTELKNITSRTEPDDNDLVSKSNIIKKDYSKEDAQYINKVLQGYQNLKASADTNTGEVSLEPDIDKLKEILNNVDLSNNNESFSSSGLELLTNIGQALESSLEGMRDSMYINEYAMGNFKNILSQNSANANQPEKDLSGILKSKRNTHYDGEIEYILCGMKNQKNNIYAVEAQMLLVRFALNTLAIYMDAEKVTQALATAEAIAGVTVFGVPIIQTLILLGWSLAESIADVKLIMDGGKVPVYKVKGDWLLDRTSALKDFAKVTAGQVGSKIVDFGESKIEDLTEAAKDKIDKMIEIKVSDAVDKVFAPLEHGLNVSGDNTEDISNQILDDINTITEDRQGSKVMDIQNAINALSSEEFNACREEILQKINSQPTDIALSIITARKNNIKSSIKSKITTYTEELKSEVNEAAGKGAENLKEYLSTALGDGTKVGSSVGGSVISSMTAMGYQDYLRLFLLMRKDNTKLLRIADLIQLNMRLESNDEKFCLENCNTYIRLKATVSMKYLFMTSSIMPNRARLGSESRHGVNLLIYQGY